MSRVLQDFDLAPWARVQYTPSPECTRDRQGANYADVGSALHVTGNSVEDASSSHQQWKCVTFHASLRRGARVEEVRETWDAEGKSLFVCFDLREVGEESFCKKLEQHLPKIKQLCVHYGPNSLSRKHPVVQMLMRNEALQMEKFTLICPVASRLTKSDLQADDLFRNHAPQLRWMTVMPGMAVLPSALSQLQWYKVVHRPDERINGFDLYTQLSLMTSLEDLEIVSDTYSRDKLNWEGRAEIQLSQLRRLSVKDDTNNCDQLLTKITVPAPCSVEVTFLVQDTCQPERRYAHDVGRLVRRWITAGRDGVPHERREVQTPDANGRGDDPILYITKASSTQGGWKATWTFEGRLAEKVWKAAMTLKIGLTDKERRTRKLRRTQTLMGSEIVVAL